MTNPEVIIAKYENLIERALGVAKGPPHWAFVYNEEFARVHVDDGVAILSWTHAVSDYDGYTDETESVEFPSSLLVVSAEVVAEWKAAEKKKYDSEQARKVEAERAENTARERELLARLQAKYL